LSSFRQRQTLSLWAGLSLLLAGLFGLFSLVGLALFFYGTRVETRRFRLEKLKVKTGLPSQGELQSDIHIVSGKGSGIGARSVEESLEGARTLRILHISDLHLRRGDDKKVEFIRAITDDDFDMVVLTGDVFSIFG
jgi:hypothetical protein